MLTDHQIQAITQLVEKFESERNLQQSEADVRAGYIDLLFQALGWNVYNDPGQATNYRREGYVRGAGYVDVGLEIRGQPVLFLEAKRFGLIPTSSERTGDRSTDEKQAFRYARGKKISHAILTNFERLHVFNADHERLILAFDHPRQYLDRLQDLWRLSPDQVEGGSLPWWEGQLEKKDVDLDFLGALRGWRLRLANAIYELNAANPALQSNGDFDFELLMAAVQRILDRLILVRYGDDKEVLLAHDLLETMLDEYRKRGAYARPDHLMHAFTDLCHMMDEHHNTTLFAPGHVCEQVAIRNDVLAGVIEEMNCMSFRKFTSDILGNTYESYLGTKLTLRKGRIQDHERRDVRKGRGIYYTPPWVVQYIVDNTLGKRLRALEEEHGLHAVDKVRGLAVVDPACGSGSFLIYAYHVLADFYRRLNQAIAQEQARLLAEAAQFRLFETLEEIRHLPEPVPHYPQVILKEHLFGVDLDPEAAEIAAVNLTMQAFADSRLEKLPLILNENIKVGNSLISGTEADLRSYFGDAWPEERPFNWEQEFPEIMARDGFDIVIGNPPYVQLSMEGLGNERIRRYLRDSYALSMGRLNTFGFFISRGLQLLKSAGLLGFIVPNTLLTQEYYSQLRQLILEQTHILCLVTLNAMPFEAAVVENAVVVLRKRLDQDQGDNLITISHPGSNRPDCRVPQSMFTTTYNYAFTPDLSLAHQEVRRRIESPSRTLGDLVNINQAIALKKDRAASLFRQALSSKYKRVLDGRDIARYSIRWPGTYLLYDRDKIHSCKREDIFLVPEKILFRRVGERIVATLDDQQYYALNTLVVVTPKDPPTNLSVVLALMNSKLLNWYYTTFLKSAKRVFSEIQARQVAQLPICLPSSGTSLYGQFVTLVQCMLHLHQRLAAKGDVRDQEREQIEREITRTDREIDELVYDLYGLTAEERALIESEIKR